MLICSRPGLARLHVLNYSSIQAYDYLLNSVSYSSSRCLVFTSSCLTVHPVSRHGFRCIVILVLESLEPWLIIRAPMESQHPLRLWCLSWAELAPSTLLEVSPRSTPFVPVTMLTSAKRTPPCTFQLGKQPLHVTPRYSAHVPAP